MASDAIPTPQDGGEPLGYLWGRSEAETRRIVAQSQVLEPASRRLLTAAGLRPGMRVLDVGSGAGDVAMLVREMLGPAGTVLGIDEDPDILDVARERARAGGVNIEFRAQSTTELHDPSGYDFVTCRYVLHHQRDPLTFLRTLAAVVRPGGVLAIHEPGVRAKQLSTPPVQLYEDVFAAAFAAVRRSCPSYDAGYQLASLFHAAGLPEPELFSETPTETGETCSFYELAVDAFWGGRSVIEEHGLWRDGDPLPHPDDSLSQQIREAATNLHSQLQYPEQLCGWVRTAAR